ncbi:MAG: putative lipid II flippase FtsW [Clostridia bacterium]
MNKLITKGKADFWTFLFTLGLTAFGLIMVFSASAPYAKNKFDDIYSYFKTQFIAALIGFALMFLISHLDYKIYKKLAWPIIGIGLALLILCFIPGIGVSYSDARRWVKIIIEFQPSEIYKIAYIIFLSKLVVDLKDKKRHFVNYLIELSVIIVSAFIIYKQPHLSCAVIVTLVGFLIIYIGGTKIKYLILTVAPVVALGLFAAFNVDYMKERIISWLDPFADASDIGYQVVQSLYAIGSGGLFGVGLGKSTQKFLYIPEPQNDFIFSILAEEIGFVGVFAVIALFCMLLWRGMQISIYCEDLYGTLLATGITALIFIQAALNIGVVTGLVPNTGITLPFFSYGGTSLVAFLMQIGILLNISRQSVRKRELRV